MFESVDLQNIVTVAIAVALGAIIGIEREIANKPAGARTHILVCAGSALMMILGHEIVQQFQQQESDALISADPIRVLQAIVVGISFLGAGTIVHGKSEEVEGLTTAATIFLTAGIGVAVAVDRVLFAVTITLMALLLLLAVGFFERSVKNWRRKREQASEPNQSSTQPAEDAETSLRSREPSGASPLQS